MANETFIIPYPSSDAGRKMWNKRYGLNSYWAGKHWSKRKEDADFWHILTRGEMERQKVRKRPFENPVVISFWFNDRLDCSNHAAMVKMIEDGMKGRVIREDSRRWVKGIEMYFHDEKYIRIAITEV